MPLINHCGGSTFAAIIQVTHRDNAVCTCSNGSKTFSDSSTSTVSVFKVNSKGTWTITCTYGSFVETITAEITTDGQLVEVELMTFHTYGISRDITVSSPEWTRTDDAVGFDAVPSVVGVNKGASVEGYSSFDTCYPWSGIQRETLSSNDVMVKIPKFWYKRYREGNVEYIKIADKAYSGFALHPAFNHTNVEKDCIYVSAYEAYIVSQVNYKNNYASVSGKSPASNIFASSRTDVRQKGSGWEMMDISTVSALQMLILVEYANNDVQKVIGRGYCQTPSTSEKTGGCDSVPKLTGIPSAYELSSNNSATNSYSVVWRGIENLWGNMCAKLDGVLSLSGVPYVCNDPSKYSSSITSDYTALSYTIPTGVSDYYITKLGFDPDYPWIMLPSEASGGSSTTFMCDSLSATSSGSVAELSYSGGIYGSKDAGLFNLQIDIGAGRDDGLRLIYIPQ